MVAGIAADCSFQLPVFSCQFQARSTESGFGILLLPRGKRRAGLEHWFEQGVKRLHCLPWEAETGLRWAELLARLRSSARAMPIKDSLIAATALVHRLTVVTRNADDFEKAGLEVLNPFGSPAEN